MAAKRTRATKAEIEARRDALYHIVEEQRPMTVRQAFYQATVKGLVDKTENGYNMVQSDLADMRKSDDLPYEWIVDNTRSAIEPWTALDIADAIQNLHQTYRKSIWPSRDCHVQIWIEKDALSGVISPITSKYDVPLMVARGYSSITFLEGAALRILEAGKPAYLYHLGDYDPSGVNAADTIENTLRTRAPAAQIMFTRLGVLPEQIEAWSLPSRPTKQSDSRAKGFVGDSAELDAIQPNTLRGLVENAILNHITLAEYEAHLEVEWQERQDLIRFSQGAA